MMMEGLRKSRRLFRFLRSTLAAYIRPGRASFSVMPKGIEHLISAAVSCGVARWCEFSCDAERHWAHVHAVGQVLYSAEHKSGC
jgi:hypothetical protein